MDSLFSFAARGTRTPTPLGRSTSSLRVYQFHHCRSYEGDITKTSLGCQGAFLGI